MGNVPKRLRAVSLAILAAVIFGAGAAAPNVVDGASNTVAQEVTAESGRFTIIFNPNIRADTYLLDTATGQVWSPVNYTDVVGEPTVWRYMDRIDDAEDFDAWAGRQRTK